MRTGIRAALARLALLTIGLAAAVALAEGVVRVADPHARDHALPSGFFAIDDHLGWRQRANHMVEHRTRYFDVGYTTNAEGYRDPDRTDPPAPGRTRIVLLGDSQVFGWGVPRERRFTDLLEAGHPQLEVWNRAVIAYGFDQQLLDYERAGDRWEGATVVLFATTATLGRMETDYLYRKHKPRFVLDSAGALRLREPAASATTLTAMAYGLLSPLYLPYFLDRRMEVLRTALGRPAVQPRWNPQENAAATSLAAAVLDRAAGVARRRGHRLLVLADLSASSVSSFLDLCATSGIPVVSLEFPGERERFRFGPEDPHWNERGHEIVARQFWTQWTRISGSEAVE